MKYRLILLRNKNVVAKEITGRMWWLKVVAFFWVNTNFLLYSMRFSKDRDFMIVDL